jgi:SpoVK/Ycf46/Vps4 family AAA+-type ATPase
MATAEQLKALLKSHSEGNGDHFVSVALQIAAHAARTGKGQLAQDLRDLVDEIKRKQSAGKIGGAVPIARPTGELAGLLAVTYPKTRFAEMVLAPDTRRLLERVIREYRRQSELRSHGLSARRKLLLLGPSGCGKTMTALAMAGELKFPLFSVQLHGLITKYMGETASKLYAIFEAMKQTRGVYFFDEFDAIGADRASKNDVGEIRRVLNSFLQFLEQDDSDSLVIAATNYFEMLDEALFRRFDDAIPYMPPTSDQVSELIRNRLHGFLIKKPDWEQIRKVGEGLSHAEITRACDEAAKDCILRNQKKVGTTMLISVLNERHRAKKPIEPSQ